MALYYGECISIFARVSEYEVKQNGNKTHQHTHASHTFQCLNFRTHELVENSNNNR